MQVAPTILEPTAEKIVNQITRLSPFFSHFQIDIQDGIYVQNKTASLSELISYCDSNSLSFKKYNINVDLMVKKTETAISNLRGLSAHFSISTVLVHDTEISDYEKLATTYPQYGIGFSLNPEDNVHILSQKYNLNKVPIIQVMTVNVGPQGQPFIPEPLNKIDQLRDLNYRNIITIDGSVNASTIPTILARKEKPDIAYIGSFVTKPENLSKSIDILKGFGLLGQ